MPTSLHLRRLVLIVITLLVGAVVASSRVARFATDDRPGPSEIAAPGHTNVDVGASWLWARIEVRGAIRNVLNRAYYASPDPRFVLAPGVNGFVTIGFKY